MAPGDDGDVPGWADAYELYYRTDRAFTGPADLYDAGVVMVSPPAPHIAHREELYSLDISSTSGSYIALALVAYDEQGNSSVLLTTEVLPLGGNTPPNAVNDSRTVDEDSQTTISVLGNDTDGDGDPLDVISVTQPTHGVAQLHLDDTVTYTPDADYFGPDSFQYTIVDGRGGSDTATMTLTVNPVPDNPTAVDDSAFITEEHAGKVIGVLANDFDVDGDSLIVFDVIQSPNSTVVNEVDFVTYIPHTDFSGTDTFTYTISDGTGNTASATVTVTVMNTPDPPTANDDTSGATEETPVTIDVLANDTDPDGDTLTVLSVGSAGSGAVTVNGGADVTYTPNLNFTGNDTFVYTISDGNGGNDTASVTVSVSNVNDNPVAVADSVTTLKDLPVTVAVLDNDFDVEGDALVVDWVTDGASGAVTNNGVDVTYAPGTDFVGEDTFTYTVRDSYGATDSASVTVDVQINPGHPIANNDAAATGEDTTVIIDVLANDVDFESDPLTIASKTDGTFGTVTSNGTELTYAPELDFFGTDQFAYTVDDGNGNTDEGTVTVTVNSINDAPVAFDDSVTAMAGEPRIIDVLGNDTDVDSPVLSVFSAEDGSGGTVANNGTDVTYTSIAGFAGTDQFTYLATDGTDYGTGAVTVTVHNTAIGPDVTVNPYDAVSGQPTPVEMTFDQVNVSGITSCVSSLTGPPPPAGYRSLEPAVYYALSTTAGYAGNVEICLGYQGLQVADEWELRLYHDNGSGWEEVTLQQIFPSAEEICGYTDSLSSFGVFEPVPAATSGGGGGGGGCFIATAAYGSPLEPQVDLLRAYRDGYLVHRAWGRLLLKAYYTLSPVPADFISNKPNIRAVVRMALAPIIASAGEGGRRGVLPVAMGFIVIMIPLGIAGWGSFCLGRGVRKRFVLRGKARR